MDDLKGKYDLIVLGTGLTESIIASAASRVGKTVIHLDPNDFYGGYWASFNLNSLNNYAEKSLADKNIPIDDTNIFNTINSRLLNVKQVWKEIDEGNATDKEYKENLVNKDFRRFNVDITPKILFSRGSLVELLISSNISRYAEFRACDHVLTLFEEKLKVVPSSRSDVFNSKELTIVEKRLLMKLLSSCISYNENSDEWKIYEEKSFIDFLKENNLTDKLITYISNAIAMCNEKTKFKDGLESTKKFLSCLGRYGNSPFLFPMYGCGEIPQCFCRLCAVFGGVYCLQRTIEEVKINADNLFSSIKISGQDIEGENIVIGSGVVNKNIYSLICEQNENNIVKFDEHKCGGISRAIFLTRKSLGDDEANKGGGGVSFMQLNDDQGNPAYITQLSHFSGTCATQSYLIHITTKSSIKDDPQSDIKPFEDKILKDRTDIFYSLYFNIPHCIKCVSNEKTLSRNIFISCGPFFEPDYDLSIEQARQIFLRIYPNEEFLPRAPDPEEIIIGDDDDAHEVKEDEVNSEATEAQEVESTGEKQSQDEAAVEAREDDESLVDVQEAVEAN